MRSAWAVLPLHEWLTMLNELTLWFKRTDGLLSLIQMISWTSTADLHIPSSTRTSGITKYVQSGCQSSLELSTNGNTMGTGMQILQRYREGKALLQPSVTDDKKKS